MMKLEAAGDMLMRMMQSRDTAMKDNNKEEEEILARMMEEGRGGTLADTQNHPARRMLTPTEITGLGAKPSPLQVDCSPAPWPAEQSK